jgi:thiamine-phosphate pyrophosphorylase
VNDRLDVALAEPSDGVHLGENSLPVEDARRLLLAFRTHAFARDFLIGVSCHSPEAAKSAAAGGADYIFFGPVFATPSKAAYGVPQGLERLAEVCSSVNIPVLAIGGISLANAASCFSAGASGIAAIRFFQDSADPVGVVRALRGQSS